MQINFILFTILIEKYSKWSNLKVTKDNNEYIIDIAKWRIYIF